MRTRSPTRTESPATRISTPRASTILPDSLGCRRVDHLVACTGDLHGANQQRSIRSTVSPRAISSKASTGAEANALSNKTAKCGRRRPEVNMGSGRPWRSSRQPLHHSSITADGRDCGSPSVPAWMQLFQMLLPGRLDLDDRHAGWHRPDLGSDDRYARPTRCAHERSNISWFSSEAGIAGSASSTRRRLRMLIPSSSSARSVRVSATAPTRVSNWPTNASNSRDNCPRDEAACPASRHHGAGGAGLSLRSAFRAP